MSYSNADKVRYQFPEMDFGASAGATVYHFQGPVGREGYLRNIGVDVTEATVFATTLGTVAVGVVDNADAYGKLNIATATADDLVFDVRDDTDCCLSDASTPVLATIPANTVVYITLTEGTGAGLAGKGIPFVEIDWL